MCHTVFARGFATTSVATHLTLNLGFPIIRLSQPGGCIDPTGSLAERQRRSPRGCSTATGNRTLDPTNGAGRSQDCATEPQIAHRMSILVICVLQIRDARTLISVTVWRVHSPGNAFHKNYFYRFPSLVCSTLRG